MPKPTVPAASTARVRSVLLLLLGVLALLLAIEPDRMTGDRAAISPGAIANASSEASAYDRGIAEALQAWQATDRARTSRDWQAVARGWSRAAFAMQSVPTGDRRWILAQKKTREYLAGAAFAFDRAEQSQSARPNWTFGSDVLDEKLALYAAHVAAEGVPDVVVVGSSRALQAIDPSVLQQELERRSGAPVRVLNLGVNGATAQVVDRFVREILPTDSLPRAIVWADGVRAFNSGRPDRTDAALRESPGYRAIQRGDFDRFAAQPDDIDGSSPIRADGFLPIETRFDPGVYYQTRSRVAGRYDGDYANFSLGGAQAEATRRLLDFAEANDIAVTLVPLPLTVEYLDSTRSPFETEFRQFFARLARNYGRVTTLDLPRTRPNRDFEDPSHLNRFGAAEVTRAVARQLAL